MDQYAFSQAYLRAKAQGMSDQDAAAAAMQITGGSAPLAAQPPQPTQPPSVTLPGVGMAVPLSPQEPAQEPPQEPQSPYIPPGEIAGSLMQRYLPAPQVNPYTGQGMPSAYPQMPEPPNLIRGVDLSRLEAIRSKLDTAAGEAAETGFEEREAALKQISDIDARRAAIVSQAKQEALQEYNASIAEQADREQKMRQQLDDKLAAYHQATEDFLNTKVDPSNYWENASTGSKILAAISVAIGGFQAGLTGGRNVALDIINQAIDRDIEAQKIRLNKMGRRAEMAQNEYNLARQHFSDETSQANAARKMMLDKAQMQIEAELSKTDSERARAAGRDLLGQLELQKQDALSKIRDRELMQAYKLESDIIQQKRANVQQWNAAEMAKYQTGIAAMKGGEEKGSPVPGVSFRGEKPSRQQVSAAFSVSRGLNEFKSAAGELRKLKEEVREKAKTMGAWKAIEYGKQREKEIKQEMREAYKNATGVDMQVDIGSSMSTHSEKKLKAVLALIEKKARDRLDNLGADLDLPEGVEE